jgi:hypothetical protein
MKPTKHLITILGAQPVMLALVVLAVVITACGSPSSGTNPSLAPDAADVTISARDIAFDRETITVPAETAWSQELVNELTSNISGSTGDQNH